jgi:hypothetical protein
MSYIHRIGLAAALVIGSASLASAQTYEAGSASPPNAATVYHGSPLSRAQARAMRRNEQTQYDNSQEPWSSSFDAGNTSGGN